MFVNKKMTRNIVTITKDASVLDAFQLMQQYRIRQIPVVKKDNADELVGLVTDRDLRHFFPRGGTSSKELSNLKKTTIEKVMIPDPITINPLAPIEDAAWLMCEHKVGGIPVVDNGKLVGIITESDIMKTFVEMMGLYHKSSRITIEIADRAGSLEGAVHIIKDCGVNILSIVVFPSENEYDRPVAVFRIDIEDTEKVMSALEKGGYAITHVQVFKDSVVNIP